MYSKQSFTQLLRKDAEARLVCRKVKLTAKRIRLKIIETTGFKLDASFWRGPNCRKGLARGAEPSEILPSSLRNQSIDRKGDPFCDVFPERVEIVAP